MFPIGYVATSNANSKGSFVSGQLAASATNIMFEPNAGCNKEKEGYSLISEMENRAIWTRKVGEHRHTIQYNYNNIFNWEFRQIRRFLRDVADYKANSFYIVDFSSGQKVTALATGGGIWNASIYDTTDFTATSAEGGKFVCIWYPNQSKFRIGGISTKAEDSSITFSDSDDYGDLEDFSLGKVFAYPMYRVYLVDDKEGFEVTNFVDVNENASFAGPVRSGELNFIQRDVK